MVFQMKLKMIKKGVFGIYLNLNEEKSDYNKYKGSKTKR